MLCTQKRKWSVAKTKTPITSGPNDGFCIIGKT